MKTTDILAQGIARYEGFYKKGTISQRLNNPGNLIYVGQKGATKVPGSRFAKFNTPQDGWDALKGQISLDSSRGHTLTSFMGKYAPPKENNTKLYIQYLSHITGIPSNGLLKKYLK